MPEEKTTRDRKNGNKRYFYFIEVSSSLKCLRQNNILTVNAPYMFLLYEYCSA